MTSAALLLTLALGQYGPWVGVGIQPGGGRVATYSGRVAEYRLGARDWYGAPAPTVCASDAAYAFICNNGVTQTPEGVVTSAGSPFYGGGYAAAIAAGNPSIGRQNAVRFNGSTNSVSFGNTGSLVSGGYRCSRFLASTVSGDADLMGRWDAGQYQWTVWRNGATLKFTVSKSSSDPTGGNISTLTVGTISAGAWNAACVSYDPSGAALRASLNGTTATAITNGVTPPLLGSSEFRVATGAHGHWAGDVADVVWGDSPRSDAQLDQMVASQIGLLASKPAGTVLPFSRADVGFTCPVLDSECYWVGSGVPEIDRRGIWVGGAAQSMNKFDYSSDARYWSQRAGNPVTITYSTTGGPDGGPSSCLVGVGAAITADIWRATSGITPNALTATQFYLKKTSASGTLRVKNPSDGSNTLGDWSLNLAAVGTGWELITSGHAALTETNPFKATSGGGSGMQFYVSSGTLDFCIALATQQESPVVGKPRYTAGSAYTGVATTHQGIPPRTDAETWVNTILQSEDMTTTWDNVRTLDTANAAVAQDGSFTADKVYENDTTSGPHYLTQAYTATAAPWTGSIEAKAGERTWLLLAIDGGSSGYFFNLATCTKGSIYISGVTGTATPLADGWCRVSVTKTMTAGASSFRVYLASADSVNVYAGVAGSGLYLTRAQITPTATEKPYCPTLASASTCGTSGGVGKTVVNLIPTNETLAGAAWTGSTVPVAVADPFGGTSAIALTETGWGARYTNGGLVASSAAGTYIVGTWAKMDGGAGKIRLTDTTAAATVCDLDPNTTDWAFYKCSGSVVAGHVLNLAVYPAGGSGTHTMSVARMQLEQATFAGRYCGPTSAASKTCVFVERAAKPWAISVTGVPSGPWGIGVARYLWVLGSSSVNSALTTLNAGNAPQGITYDSVGGYRYINHTLTGSSETKWLYSVDGASGESFWIGETLQNTPVGNGTGIMSFAPMTLTLGASSSGSGYFYGWIKSWASCTKSPGCK